MTSILITLALLFAGASPTQAPSTATTVSAPANTGGSVTPNDVVAGPA